MLHVESTLALFQHSCLPHVGRDVSRYRTKLVVGQRKQLAEHRPGLSRRDVGQSRVGTEDDTSDPDLPDHRGPPLRRVQRGRRSQCRGVEVEQPGSRIAPLDGISQHRERLLRTFVLPWPGAGEVRHLHDHIRSRGHELVDEDQRLVLAEVDLPAMECGQEQVKRVAR